MYNELIRIINNSNKIVFFGGAGTSTDCGIPDYRSGNGLYNNNQGILKAYSPEYLLSRRCLYNNSKLFFLFYREYMNMLDIQPGILHKALVKLENENKLSGIVTQNIDGLHQKAGSKNVLEIHGTSLTNYCVKCKKTYPAEFIFNNTEKVPHCIECGHMIRPNVVMYGEEPPYEEFEKAKNIIRDADCLIIAGTSLKVAPSSYLPDYFKGDNLIIINNEETPLDRMANLVIHNNLSEVFKDIIEEI